MKEKMLLLTVALMTASPLFFSCSVDDIPVGPSEFYVEPEANGLPDEATSERTFTAILKAKDTQRLDTLGSGLKTAWQIGEKIAICYQKTNGKTDIATAVVDSLINGNAHIIATLDNAEDTLKLKFVYPASVVSDKGDIDTAQLLNQHGTLADVIANYDVATGSGTLSWPIGDSTCYALDTIAMKSCIAIGKITPKKDGKAMNGIKELTVSDGTNTYHIKPEKESFDTTGIYVAMLPISNKTVTYTATDSVTFMNYFCQTEGNTMKEGQVYTTITPSLKQVIILSLLTSHYTAIDGDILTGTLTGKCKISIADDAAVTLNNITIDGTKDSCEWAGITCLGNATLHITGTNSVKGFDKRYPGIQAGPEGKTLTMDGDGSLKAQGGASGGAGIGSGQDMTCGNITINGGSIDARGGFHGAGIGSGQGKDGTSVCGNITISGGTIKATAGPYAAGIGCGYTKSTCGKITIDKTVKELIAVRGSEDEDDKCQCIGKGNKLESCKCDTITIRGVEYPNGVEPNSGDDTFYSKN